jgi:uncharacterized repeat protein (TIGR03803 family)
LATRAFLRENDRSQLRGIADSEPGLTAQKSGRAGVVLGMGAGQFIEPEVPMSFHGRAFFVGGTGVLTAALSFALSGCSGGSGNVSASIPPQTGLAEAARSFGSTASMTRQVPGSYKTLYSFGSQTEDGGDPRAALINVAGTLYGTTESGGGTGYGTIFDITASGEESVVYRFMGGLDGADPYAGVINVGGTLYGATEAGGGAGCGGPGCGAIFSATTSGTENVIYRFAGGSDGSTPFTALTNVGGTLYGTTYGGGGTGCGGSGCGTVFSASTSGTENVIYRFAGDPDGAYPYAPLIDINGTLYGTTVGGGKGGGICGEVGCGTVFSVTSSGVESVLHSFSGGADGAGPMGLINIGGTLYGTTSGGGGTGCGGNGCGTVFTITTTGAESVLYAFKGSPKDGQGPTAALINVGGDLYGTTYHGGTKSRICEAVVVGCGTIFKMTTSGAERVLHFFKGFPEDGQWPVGALLNVDGVLYGTTLEGGLAKNCSRRGCGTVYSIQP